MHVFDSSTLLYAHDAYGAADQRVQTGGGGRSATQACAGTPFERRGAAPAAASPIPPLHPRPKPPYLSRHRLKQLSGWLAG
mgnify:CR=1 FL=1